MDDTNLLALAIGAIVSLAGIVVALAKMYTERKKRDSDRPRETLPSVDPLATTGQHQAVTEISAAASDIRQVSHHLRGLPTREDFDEARRALNGHADRLEQVAWDLETIKRAHATVRERVQDHQLRLDDHGQRIAGIELHLGEAPEGGQQ